VSAAQIPNRYLAEFRSKSKENIFLDVQGWVPPRNHRSGREVGHILGLNIRWRLRALWIRQFTITCRTKFPGATCASLRFYQATLFLEKGPSWAHLQILIALLSPLAPMVRHYFKWAAARTTKLNHMNENTPRSKYLVLSRGQWDKNASKQDIESAIERFYEWLAKNVEQGKMKTGNRLGIERALVSKAGIITDQPFAETKEVIGGYWFVMASNLREAARLAAQNPCAQFGLSYEIRPLELARASAYDITNETPSR
jgi:hypothetical protein